MRLTLLRLSGRKHRSGGARGNKKSGKHQEPHVISSHERKTFVQNLLQECTNEMWLTRPYLNKRQEKYLSTKFVQTSKGNPLRRFDTKLLGDFENLKYRINMPQHVHFEDRWSYLKVASNWKSEDKDLYKKCELERYARAVIPKRYPDFYPHAVEKWEEWNKIEGFGLKKKDNLSTAVALNKKTDVE